MRVELFVWLLLRRFLLRRRMWRRLWRLWLKAGVDRDMNGLSGHVIICGLGHVGYRCLRLLTRLGEPAVVIARETSDQWCLGAESHSRVIIGDAREDRLLCQAGIDRAKAIIVVTDDDLTNVSIALDARRLNPAIAIVVRLFDQELAAHLERSMQINCALSASALAAPAFVAAALGETVRGSFHVGGTTCLIEKRVVETPSDSAGHTIRQWSAHTGHAVIALHRGEEITPRPASTAELLPGDRLTFLRLPAHEEQPGAMSRPRPRNRTDLSAVREFVVGVREWWREFPRALRTGFLVLLAVVVVSVGVFRWGLSLSPVDSLYFVITTITTVGYGDINLLAAPTLMKLYGVFLMLCGAAIIAVLFSMVTDLILKTRLRDLVARRCAGFAGHVIVAGLGNIGYRVVRHLVHSGETVVAVERRQDGQFVQAARELAFVVLGDAKTEESLRKAGVTGAKALLAVTDDDLANLSIGLTAKRTNAACRAVLRIFDSQLAEKMQHGLGVDSVLSTSAAAAPTFVGAALCPDVVQGIVLPDFLVLVLDRTIRPGSIYLGRRADEMDKSESALFVKRMGTTTYTSATADYVLREGDEVLGARWCPFKNRQADQ